jgi:hypothetical protein
MRRVVGGVEHGRHLPFAHTSSNGSFSPSRVHANEDAGIRRYPVQRARAIQTFGNIRLRHWRDRLFLPIAVGTITLPRLPPRYSTPPTPPAASCATAWAPTRCRSGSWAGAPSRRVERGSPAAIVVLRQLQVIVLAVHPDGLSPGQTMLGEVSERIAEAHLSDAMLTATAERNPGSSASAFVRFDLSAPTPGVRRPVADGIPL